MGDRRTIVGTRHGRPSEGCGYLPLVVGESGVPEIGVFPGRRDRVG